MKVARVPSKSESFNIAHANEKKRGANVEKMIRYLGSHFAAGQRLRRRSEAAARWPDLDFGL